MQFPDGNCDLLDRATNWACHCALQGICRLLLELRLVDILHFFSRAGIANQETRYK